MARDEQNNIFKMIMAELTERRVLYAEKFSSLYAISAGAHMLNIVNKDRKILILQGLPPDLRIHVFMVCPSGFGKTFQIRQYLDKYSGIFRDVLPVAFEGPMTEAAWVGTIKFKDGEPIVIFGAAYEYRYSIVGVEEFSAIVAMMKSSHSKMLAPQLLTSLDSGIVRKRLAGMGSKGAPGLAYETAVTLWTGDRPATFDLGSGMARRLTMIPFNPTRKDIEAMRYQIRSGYNVNYNPARLGLIKKMVLERKEETTKVEHIEFTEETDKLLDEINVIPYEEIIYKRIMLGYTVMKDKVRPNMLITVDKTIRKIVLQVAAWQKEIKRGADVNQVIAIIEDYKGVISQQALQATLANFNVYWNQSAVMINRLVHMGILRRREKDSKRYLALR